MLLVVYVVSCLFVDFGFCMHLYFCSSWVGCFFALFASMDVMVFGVAFLLFCLVVLLGVLVFYVCVACECVCGLCIL